MRESHLLLNQIRELSLFAVIVSDNVATFSFLKFCLKIIRFSSSPLVALEISNSMEVRSIKIYRLSTDSFVYFHFVSVHSNYKQKNFFLQCFCSFRKRENSEFLMNFQLPISVVSAVYIKRRQSTCIEIFFSLVRYFLCSFLYFLTGVAFIWR